MQTISTPSEVINNSLKNLILTINPNLKCTNKSFLEQVLIYRISEDAVEIDSCELVKKAYTEFYVGEEIPQKADTILNIINPLKAFCIFRLKELSKVNENLYPFQENKNNRWVLREGLLKIILDNLDQIFTDDYYNLKILFNNFAEVTYSFANLMPVPNGYNAHSNCFGKGSYHENNDYPYFYYKNLKGQKDTCIKIWLDNNMEKYYLKEIFELIPPFKTPDAYYSEANKTDLEKYLVAAIVAIKNRGELIRKNFIKLS